jgi:hypothetical protein
VESGAIDFDRVFRTSQAERGTGGGIDAASPVRLLLDRSVSQVVANRS